MQRLIARRALVWLMVVFIVAPPWALGQQSGGASSFKQEDLDQILAPIALYPDSLVTQVLMASTYPLEVVQADRFAKKNKDLKGDALTKALEAQNWDPSVKSLVNFPQVLDMMGQKLDWTQKLGDAFLAQQKDVLDTVQSLRAKAKAAGNLESTKEQIVIVEEKIIKIEPANPQVVYVPVYNPTVVYGAWWYPAYPPYYYYPPGYVAARTTFAFATGVAVGAAWGYAWGRSNWRGGNVDVNINRNTNINNNINRNNYKGNVGSGGRGNWQHNPEHRKGVGYRDNKTADKFNKGRGSQDAKSREAFRGRAEQGRQDIARGGADKFKGRGDAGRPSTADRARGGDRGAAGNRGSASQLAGRGGADRGGGNRGGSGSRGGAFEGINRGGSSARSYSQRGSSSRGGGRHGSRGGGGRRR